MSTGFFQDGPRLENTFTTNRWLKAYLRKTLPPACWAEVEEDLTRLGERCVGEYLATARRAEREKPTLVQFDPWGRRIDELRVSSAWRELQDISAREELVHLGYARRHKEFSRLHQFAKLYLFHPSSAFFTCPLAMADGAAKVLETYGNSDLHKAAFAHLTAKDPAQFWTSGQWMTEKTGGSDVSGTSTIARVNGSEVRLFGVKWFSSATTSEMALALARFEGAPEGSRGLTLFLVPMYTSPGQLNGLQVLRLKDKLGTWALPTAELQLNGALAYQVGEIGQGVKTVASMLNITRLYNSICSCGQMTRALDQLRDYSTRRMAFGAHLSDHVLHQGTFAREEMRSLAGFLLTMEMVRRLGREECGTASREDQDMLRLFTPVAKMFTARSSIQVASEVIEGFGGAGYVEDTGLPVHLRDAQVFSIWEGATNVLSLDLLRVVQKTAAMTTYAKEMDQRLKNLKTAEVQNLAKQALGRWTALARALDQWVAAEPIVQMANAREIGVQFAWNYAQVLLLSWADVEEARNQGILCAWAREMASLSPDFKLKSASEIEISKVAFAEKLTATSSKP